MTARGLISLAAAAAALVIAAQATAAAPKVSLGPPETVPLTPPPRPSPHTKTITTTRPTPLDPQARLDRLYDRLAEAKSADEADGIAAVIAALRQEGSSDTANILTDRALDLLRRKDEDGALRLLDVAVAVAPAATEAWNQRAMIYYKKGDYGRAMHDLREVLRHDPRRWMAWEALGRILEQTSDKKDALAAYRRALAIDPQLSGLQQRVERLAVDVEGRRL